MIKKNITGHRRRQSNQTVWILLLPHVVKGCQLLSCYRTCSETVSDDSRGVMKTVKKEFNLVPLRLNICFFSIISFLSHGKHTNPQIYFGLQTYYSHGDYTLHCCHCCHDNNVFAERYHLIFLSRYFLLRHLACGGQILWGKKHNKNDL